MPRESEPRRFRPTRGAMTKQEGPRPSPKLENAAPNRLNHPRSSKGRTPAVTSEAIQVRILAGEPRISGAEAVGSSPAPDQNPGIWPLSYDRNLQYSTRGPSLQLRDFAP